ncbi:MAG: carbon-nitrogen hydrolase family protein [Pseudomonadota bacterium]|nr:carbon-nitrogen hydrolase family protein [Pseudomonadota bacterium]
MTRNRRFKSLVRARAAKTGESYSTALSHLRKIVLTNEGECSSVPSLRIAVAQSPLFNSLSDRSGLTQHGERLRNLMRAARGADAKLIQFPETSLFQPEKRALFSTGPKEIGPADWSRVDWSALQAEFEKIRAEAQHLGLWTVIGLPHRDDGSTRPFNSLFVISADGKITIRYDERMLSYTKTSFLYARGNRPQTFDISGLRFACALGTESHYPEIAMDYEGRDVDCLLVSTTGGTSERQRAFEAEIIGHSASLAFWTTLSVHAFSGQMARSLIAAPHGHVAAIADSNASPSLIFADLTETLSDPARIWRRQIRADLHQNPFNVNVDGHTPRPLK